MSKKHPADVRKEFDDARLDLWQRSEAVKAAEQLGAVQIDSRPPAGYWPPRAPVPTQPVRNPKRYVKPR